RKECMVPLWPRTSAVLKEWFREAGQQKQAMASPASEPISRFAIHLLPRKAVGKAVPQCGSLAKKHISPHEIPHIELRKCALALEQCNRRNLPPGPLNTHHGWLERKRHVRKGEKGITLCMPMMFKKTAQNDGDRKHCRTTDRPCLPPLGILVRACTNREGRDLHSTDPRIRHRYSTSSPEHHSHSVRRNQRQHSGLCERAPNCHQPSRRASSQNLFP